MRAIDSGSFRPDPFRSRLPSCRPSPFARRLRRTRCSAGITPLLSSYGGSDSCRAGSSGTFCYHELPSCPGRSPVFTCALFPRHTITNHPGRHLPRIRDETRRLRCSRTADFASVSQARRGCRSRIVFICHYGLSGRFRCSPPRLAATQLLQLLGGTTATAGLGLSPRKSAPLDGARDWFCKPVARPA